MSRFHGNRIFYRGHKNTDALLGKVFLTELIFNVEPQKEYPVLKVSLILKFSFVSTVFSWVEAALK